MPCHGHAVHELLFVLRMNFGTLFDGRIDHLSRRHRRELVVPDTVTCDITAEEDASTAAKISGCWITNGRNGLVGIGYSAIDVIVSLPESAFKLQADLKG